MDPKIPFAESEEFTSPFPDVCSKKLKKGGCFKFQTQNYWKPIRLYQILWKWLRILEKMSQEKLP